MSVPLLIALTFVLTRTDQDFWVVAAGALAGSVGLVLTQSRGGYLGFAASVAIVIWFSGGKVRIIGTVAGMIGLAAVVVSPLGGRIRDGLQVPSFGGAPVQVTSDNFAAQEREAHWAAAVRMAEDSPLLGVGAGNFNERYREETPVWRFRIPRGHAHSNYLQALAQAGLLGIVSYLGLLGMAIATIAKKLRNAPDPLSRSFAIGAAGVTAAVMVHGVFDYLHVLSLGILLSAVWGMAAALPEHEYATVTAE
jgi:O-antigen ligase